MLGIFCKYLHLIVLEHFWNARALMVMRDFVNIRETTSSKLGEWKARVLSQAGKRVLIKSNLTGIPLLYARYKNS